MGGQAANTHSAKDMLRTMNEEEMLKELRRINKNREVIISFDPHRAGVEAVAEFLALVKAGKVAVDEEVHERLRVVSKYTGDRNCWGSWARRTVKLRAITQYRRPLADLVPVLRHVKLVEA